MPRQLGPGGGPSCLGIWVPPDPKWGGGGGGGGGTRMPVTPVSNMYERSMHRIHVNGYGERLLDIAEVYVAS